MTTNTSTEWSHEWILDRVCESCPEKGHELRSIVARRNIIFEADIAREDFYFAANPEGRIRFTVQPLKRLWALVYAHLSNYEAVTHRKAADPSAIQLLKWAISADMNATCSLTQELDFHDNSYPEDSPKPFDEATDDPIIMLASDITMIGMGFILLHEIAHVELEHPAMISPRAKIEEDEADEWAVDTILKGIENYCSDQYPDRESAHILVTQKRSLGLLLTFLWIMGQDHSRASGEFRSHPPTNERLYKAICTAVTDSNDLIWAFSHTAMATEFCLSVAERPKERFNTFREAVEHWCLCIARGGLTR